MRQSYRVILQPKAWIEIDEALNWLSEQSQARAARWLSGLRNAVDTLRAHPGRCPLAPENAYFDEEVRQLLYGKRRGVYRILFIIREQRVHVISIRHSARDVLKPEDVE